MTINTQTHHPTTTKPKPKPDPESNQVLKIEKGTTKIKISSGTLTTFPLPILTCFDTLTHLDLSNNPSLSTLPASISRLHKLKIAFFSSCAFTTFPAQLAQCRSLEMIAFKSNAMTCIPENAFPRKLRWLILTDNRLEALPESIGRCAGLQKCMLAGNRLRGLPDGMRACRKLGLLRLSGNLMEGVPGWVLGLPELSYLSFAGNPCSSRGSNSGGGNGVDKAMLDEIAWEELEIQHVLGEGASGVISKGIWKRSSSPSPSPSTSTSEQEKAPGVDIDVAVKVFKGALTSDGSPLDEMHATITAGKHPNLIDPLGRITGKTGLVLQLIPPTYTNLGLPPSLDSCTRDSFPADTVFTLDVVKGVLRGIASAARHLHERGIMHGDLYAHNILLSRASGHALLGDFGAATVYGDVDVDVDVEGRLERMEVLGFGHLVEDLLGLVVHDVGEWHGDVEGDLMSEKDAMAVEALNALHWRCCDPVIMGRPGFKEVVEELEGI